MAPSLKTIQFPDGLAKILLMLGVHVGMIVVVENARPAIKMVKKGTVAEHNLLITMETVLIKHL